MEDRFPQLEYTIPGLDALEAEKGPRLMKTHLPYEMLPQTVQTEGKTKVGDRRSEPYARYNFCQLHFCSGHTGVNPYYRSPLVPR